MNNIVEYFCVSETGDFKLLNKTVNALIQEGFQPIGGVSQVMGEDAVYFAQAMVKYVKPKNQIPTELPAPSMVG